MAAIYIPVLEGWQKRSGQGQPWLCSEFKAEQTTQNVFKREGGTTIE